MAMTFQFVKGHGQSAKGGIAQNTELRFMMIKGSQELLSGQACTHSEPYAYALTQKPPWMHDPRPSFFSYPSQLGSLHEPLIGQVCTHAQPSICTHAQLSIRTPAQPSICTHAQLSIRTPAQPSICSHKNASLDE
eukprot:scaffold32638_cov21-Tisochrysis_lutea.AAC.1